MTAVVYCSTVAVAVMVGPTHERSLQSCKVGCPLTREETAVGPTRSFSAVKLVVSITTVTKSQRNDGPCSE